MAEQFKSRLHCFSELGAAIGWLVDAIPDATARAKIFGATACELYFNGE